MAFYRQKLFLHIGIKGKLALFLSFMLFTIISVMVAIFLKHQHITLANSTQEQISNSLAGINALSQQVGHLQNNLIKLQWLRQKYRNHETMANQSIYFSKSYLDRIETAIKDQIRPADNRQAISQNKFNSLKGHAAWLVSYQQSSNQQIVNDQQEPPKHYLQEHIQISSNINAKNKQKFDYHYKNLESILRQDIDFEGKIRPSLVSLDLTKMRIQSVDLLSRANFDTKYLISADYAISPVNYIALDDSDHEDLLFKEFDHVYGAFYKQQKPLASAMPLEYLHPNGSFMALTDTFFKADTITERARLVLDYGVSNPHWRRFINYDHNINIRLEKLALQWKIRRLEVERLKKLPRRDKQLTKIYQNFRKLQKEREAIVDTIELTLLKKHQPEVFLAKSVINEIDNYLNQDRISDKHNQEFLNMKYGSQQEAKELRDKYLEKLRMQPFNRIQKIADAFRNLRNAVLYDELILAVKPNLDDYQKYLLSYQIREQNHQYWQMINSWIYSFIGETNLSSSAFGSGLFIKTRSETESLMLTLQTTGLLQLAQDMLYRHTAGFNRVILDQTEYIKLIQSKRDLLIDTALALGLRVIFLAIMLSGVLVKVIQRISQKADLVGQGDLSVSFSYGGHDELGTLVQSLNRMVSGLRERERMHGELLAAEIIQKNLMPDAMPENMSTLISFGSFYKAMSGVGGDYFDFIATKKQSFVFIIADVSNHGVGPAIIMSNFRSHLHSIIQSGQLNFRELILELNERVYKETPSHIFITAFLGIYDASIHEITYFSAGHNPAYIYRQQKSKLVEVKNAGGMAFGAVNSDIYQKRFTIGKTPMHRGDFFFQYTDGLTEAVNAHDEQFGAKRLIRFLSKYWQHNPQQLVDELAIQLEAFTEKNIFQQGPSSLNDDIAIIAFRREQ